MAVKGSVNRLRGRALGIGRYVGVDLVAPAIDYVALGNSFGVPSFRAATPEQYGKGCRSFYLRRVRLSWK